MNAPLRIHWRLPQRGEGTGITRSAQAQVAETGLPDLANQIRFCRQAEECGIDSLLLDFGWLKPDSIILATALGLATERIRFIIAYRSGLMSPTTFVQQLNTLSTLIDGRFSLNVVAGYSPEEQRAYGDALPHDERYARTEEFLSICNEFWRERRAERDGRYYHIEGGRLLTPFVSSDGAIAPELLIAGASDQARALAIAEGTCWMMFAQPPDKIREVSGPVLAAGRTIGIRAAIVVRHTREEALDAAREIVTRSDPDMASGKGERQFIANKTDSVSMGRTYDSAENEWLTSYLWTGAVRVFGSSSLVLVGSPDEIVDALFEYRDAGVTQFIFSGWPKLEEMRIFGREVLPILRRREAEETAAHAENGGARACASF
jgi:alkanesulfonate monooxygenase